MKQTYQTLLRLLKTQHEEISAEIQRIEGILGSAEGGSENGSSYSSVTRKIDLDTFHGRSLVDATKLFLEIVGKPARDTREIHEKLKEGGLDNQYQTLSSILVRAANNPKTGITKVGRGKWGLSDWYPNTGRKSPKINDKGRDNEESLPPEETKLET